MMRTEGRILAGVLETPIELIDAVQTKADGPAGSLPLTDEMLRHWPSGDLFALTKCRHGLESRGRRSRSLPHPEHAGGAFACRMEHPSRCTASPNPFVQSPPST